MWADAIVVEKGLDRWAVLDENGWGAMIGWAADADNLARRPVSDEGRTVMVIVERAGVPASSEESFSPADRVFVDDSIDEYLAQAGIPPRPRGWTWLIRVPAGYSSGQDFFDSINEELNTFEPAPVRPSEWLPVMLETVARLYRNG
ncbi:DUF5956 family protein [Specibacter sp. RAF43]|uniref:DUF5956 family protein n=1 Tax=Specibacter sp. RAF43 TaxID=3233057 RepID=UPI003F94F631